MSDATLPAAPAHHILKTDPDVFEASWQGAKTHEIRFDDRSFKVGDLMSLVETVHSGAAMRAGAPLAFTGRVIERTISHIQSGYGLADGWVILSYAPFVEASAAQPQACEDAARDRLLQIIASAYQIAGFHDANAHILDVLANPEHATQEQIDAMLPYQKEAVASAEEIAADFADFFHENYQKDATAVSQYQKKMVPQLMQESYRAGRERRPAVQGAALPMPAMTPVGLLCPNDPDAGSAFKWTKAGANPPRSACTFCGTKHVLVYADAASVSAQPLAHVRKQAP